MRVITPSKIKIYIKDHPTAKSHLHSWLQLMRSNDFESLQELRKTFSNSVDHVGSYHIFNICGNNDRLITACHYNTNRVYIRDFQTHAEYSKKAYQSNIKKGEL